MVLTVNNLSKTFGHLTVLDGVSFTVARGQRLGVVGANGSGKSTLLKLIAGELEPDSGSVTIGKGIERGYLPQVIQTFQHQSVQALIESATASIRQLEAEMRAIEVLMATASGTALAALLEQYGTLSDIFEHKGGYELEHRTATVLEGMQAAQLERARPVATLSGGEKTRIALAMLLLQQPDLLLLDEPTNHLDGAVLAWLERYLQEYTGGVVVVSHDRAFLNHAVTGIMELDERSHQAKRYAGNFDAYMQAKQQERERWHREYAEQQNELTELRHALKVKVSTVDQYRPMRDNDKLGFNSRGESMQQARSGAIQAVKERIGRIEANPIPRPPQPLRINPDFDPQALANRSPLWISGLRKSFGGRGLRQPASAMVSIGERIVITGANGSGKSTLLKVLAGIYKPDEGELYIAPSVKVGYLDQEQESLDLNATLFEAYCAGFERAKEEMKAELFHYGLFVYDDLAKQVGALSVGQRRKLQLARLMATRANLLLLDEPTNHLAFEVLEAFEAALLRFPGAILAVSHDRYFTERFATRVWEIRDGALREVQGDDALSFS